MFSTIFFIFVNSSIALLSSISYSSNFSKLVTSKPLPTFFEFLIEFRVICLANSNDFLIFLNLIIPYSAIAE